MTIVICQSVRSGPKSEKNRKELRSVNGSARCVGSAANSVRTEFAKNNRAPMGPHHPTGARFYDESRREQAYAVTTSSTGVTAAWSSSPVRMR
jgi:hypothetical protein